MHNYALRHVLAQKGWTSRKLAEVTRLSQATISLLINGHHKPHLSTKKLIAEALGVEASDLFGGEV